MACDFSFSFTGNTDTVLAKARQAVESQGGRFTGNETAGDFSVSVFGNKIVGDYTVTGQTLNIQITDKPFLIPCATIEGFLKNQIV